MTELIDLAATMRNEPMEAAAIEIETVDHAATARRLARELGIAVDELGLDGMYAAAEHVTVGTHFGTHLDAPTHYGEVIDGHAAATVDRMPLDPLFAPAVLLDFAHRELDPITAADIEAGYAARGLEPAPGQMLMTRVGIEDDVLDDPAIRHRGAGMDRSAIEWLLARGVRLTATDSMTQDMPIPWMEERLRAGERDAYFPVHFAGLRTDYVHVEKAYGLRDLPRPSGYRVAAFPVKVEGGSGAWTRFMAIIDPPFDVGDVRVVDLSQPIRRDSMEPYASEITTHGAARRRRQWAKHLGRRVSEVEARGSWDLVRASTRAGAHLEAPYRFGPECGGRPSRAVDAVPLDWCFGPAVVVDVSDGPRDLAVDRSELLRALARAGHEIRGGEIVMFHTGAASRFDGDPGFPDAGRGLGVDALAHLVERGVRVIGSDAESLDRPIPAMVRDLRAGREGALFPILREGRRYEYCGVLKLTGLDRLPPVGWWASVAPVKIEGAGSGWCRAVGFVPASATPEGRSAG
jgi:kynurenine formamidase